MAHINGITIHDCRPTLKAVAVRTDSTAWLEVHYGSTVLDKISIFMDFDRAQCIANGINGGETEWQQILDDEAEYEAERNNREPSYADEHRLRVHEVL